MNRAVISDAVFAALAECDVLARVTNAHSVSVLRDLLLTIRHETLSTTLPTETAALSHSYPQSEAASVTALPLRREAT